jgi:hypothetical protein
MDIHEWAVRKGTWPGDYQKIEDRSIYPILRDHEHLTTTSQRRDDEMNADSSGTPKLQSGDEASFDGESSDTAPSPSPYHLDYDFNVPRPSPLNSKENEEVTANMVNLVNPTPSPSIEDLLGMENSIAHQRGSSGWPSICTDYISTSTAFTDLSEATFAFTAPDLSGASFAFTAPDLSESIFAFTAPDWSEASFAIPFSAIQNA